ncbi:hypothetical protein [Rhizobium sp. C4]|uniref:hypothetical protein n=1 Tax=Rhizobium sp. C4 TaxID=1349800 RepID=UPI001E2F0429|nr:hypothetical protein [Rhizobium sp. C4]MCD2173387.1 hypothetical protein [Rhizobium sp. C4]
MSNVAAILVLVACPLNSTHCVSDPVRISTYERAQECEKSMPGEIRRLKTPGMRILGSCNTFDASLMAKMKPIDVTNRIDPAKVKRTDDAGTAVGFQDKIR